MNTYETESTDFGVTQERLLMQQGFQLHKQNRLAEAESIYRQVLAANPQHSDALFLLGAIGLYYNHYEAAEELTLHSLQLRPDNIDGYLNLGKVYQMQKRFAEAEQNFGHALKLKPERADIWFKLGQLLEIQGKWDQAEQHYQNGVAAHSDNAVMMMNLGNIYLQQNDPAKAEEIYYRAIALDPNVPEIYFNLGDVYHEQGLLEQAETLYKKALALNPRYIDALFHLSMLYRAQAKLTEAIETNLKIVEIEPNHAGAYLNLGNIYKYQGNISEAIHYYRKAYSLRPDHALAHSNYIFVLHYDPHISSEEIYRETLAWSARHTENTPWLAHSNDRSPERRLRIGYVSGDFCKHPAAVYIEPVLRHHNTSQVEIFCYSNYQKEDEVTKRLQFYADHWRNIVELSDAAAAALIQEDKIDILIDLSGHTAGNRLTLFARKPAPLQATWIGYFNTVGMKAMDYIITDRFLLPSEEEHLYVEKPLRLPNSSIVFKTHDLPIEVNALPAINNGYITFGCFNALSKLTPEVIGLWAEILKRIPNAKLYLKNKSFGHPDVCELYSSQFAALGIEPSRLTFSGFSLTPEYLKSYNDVDLGLDPFPYNGATTTLDSLWMGVPLIALKGDRLVGHIGESLLGAVGLEEFIAASKTEYVEKAVAMAKNMNRLAEIRRTLRPILTVAPLTNPTVFTRGLEVAFRGIWKEWCQRNIHEST